MLLFALGMAGSWSGLGRSAILECSAFLLPKNSSIPRYSLKTPFCPLNFFAVFPTVKTTRKVIMIISPSMSDAEICDAIAKASQRHFNQKVTSLDELWKLCLGDWEKFKSIIEE